MAMPRRPILWLSTVFIVFAGSVAAIGGLLGEGRSVPQFAALFILSAVALGAGFLVAALQIFRHFYIRPLHRLAVELRAIAFGRQGKLIDRAQYATLPGLVDALNALAGALDMALVQRNEAVAAATAGAETEKARLGAVLNDLHQGVVVCNLRHQVVLYNQKALGLLRVSGELGLGRSLSALLGMDPVLHMLEVLLRRPESGPESAPFITGTSDGRILLQGRMRLVRIDADVTGYVISFDDVTASVSALARRDALLREVIDSLQGPVARLNDVTCDPAQAAADISTALKMADEGYRSLLAGWWPMADINSAYLFGFVVNRLQDSGLKVNRTGLPIWLHGDSHTLAVALEALLRCVAKGTGATEFDLGADIDGGHGWILISWRGGRVADHTLAEWQLAPISAALGGMTVRDVMRHHTHEDLVEEARDGRVTLRIALPPGREGQDRTDLARMLPPRPEFFDFNLLEQGRPGRLGQLNLRDVTYVVFDTETTGLSPTQGDQIVSIAGVRIVNGRILTGETFSRVVNPGRGIPRESTRFHGITDQMVIDKPPLAVVLPQFKAYVADAVLVAHNAAFDLKFIRMRERESGVAFSNPVLDTMLLSSYVDGTPENQSLDAIAKRYGIPATDRHTALGDSLLTAAVLLRLIDALEAKGIHTLDDAMTTLNMTWELHHRLQAVL